MLPVTIAGRELAEFCAKMQSYPEISSCEVDVGIFQGANRSSLQLSHNRRGPRFLICKIDFIGKSNYERALHQSEFEALFLGSEPVVIDICDGFWYKAVLVEIGEPETECELITTVQYRFQITRHRGDQITASVIPNDAKIWCHSNVEQTDCVIRVLFEEMASADKIDVELNGLQWHFVPELTGDLVLDGVNKIFTMDGVNVSSTISWTDFPYLVPGENVLTLSIQGVVVSSKKAEISYTPTFL